MPSRSKRIAAAGLVALAAAAAACSLTTSLDGYTCSPETCSDAAPDTDGLGDGHMGDKHVIAQEAVNAYAALANDVAAGAATLDLAADRTIAAGDLLLVWPTIPRRRRPAVRASRAAHKRCPSPIARTSWSSARAWSARASDGRVGGIIAVLTRGGVRVDGAIVADGLGGRGGVSFANTGDFNCGSDDGVVRDGYAARGEGIVPSRYAGSDPSSMPGGRANAATGGGGGVCHNSGAGGGGNGSVGGQGGHDHDGNGVGRNAGALDGSAVTFLANDRLVIGGGGAGDRHDPTDTTGGNGGGVIFLRAHDLDVGGASAPMAPRR